tara:strand:+ start:2910 stop:3524 length:615 start_codon:yes stop_codon:yes gene_type:complete
MKSSSEIDTVSKRATKASGFSWGIAEEVGKNIKTLELLRIGGIENLNAYLQQLKDHKAEGPKEILKSNSPQGKSFCPFYTGAALIDAAEQVLELKTLKFDSIDYPILILPFINRLSYKIGKMIMVKMDKYEINLNLNQFISSNMDIQNKILKSCKSFEIHVLENKDAFKPETWERLYKLSTDTFVEESERSKNTAAGAGLVDND